jgi:hypothetical protein
MEKRFWFTTLVIAALGIISGYSKPFDFALMKQIVSYCATLPVVYAFAFQVTQTSNKLLRHIWGSMFVVVSIFGIGVLLFTAISVLKSGPLNESLSIFILIPFGYAACSLAGLVVGFIAYGISKDTNNMTND